MLAEQIFQMVHKMYHLNIFETLLNAHYISNECIPRRRVDIYTVAWFVQGMNDDSRCPKGLGEAKQSRCVLYEFVWNKNLFIFKLSYTCCINYGV